MTDQTSPAIVLFGDTKRHLNIFYRCRFNAPDPVIVVDEGGKTTLWVSPMELDRAKKEAKVDAVRSWDTVDVKRVLAEPQKAEEAEIDAARIAAICAAHNLKAITVDVDFPAAVTDWLRNHGMTVQPQMKALYTDMRRIKAPYEVKAISDAQDVGMRAMRKVIGVLRRSKVGTDGLLYRNQKDLDAGRALTGADLVKTADTEFFVNGFTGEDTICCGGPESAAPHESQSPVIRAGLPIVLDLFPRSNSTGYWGDMTRTVVKGTPNPEAQKMFDAVLEAQGAAVQMAKPGVTGGELMQRVVDVLAKHGYETPRWSKIKSPGKFIHGLGHGVGLEIHENPRLWGTQKLQVGDVFTVEPGVYDPAIGGVRIEDTYVMTARGARNVARRPVQKKALILS